MPIVCKSSAIGSGQIMSVDLQGVPVGIANVNGVLYAFSDACTYNGCSLTKGSLEGASLVCTCGSKYDLASGHVLGGPASKRIRTYHVQMDGDDVRI